MRNEKSIGSTLVSLGQTLTCAVIGLITWTCTVVSIASLIVTVVVAHDTLFLAVDISAWIVTFALSGVAAILGALLQDSLKNRWRHLGL